jgi:hypothetical protein
MNNPPDKPQGQAGTLAAESSGEPGSELSSPWLPARIGMNGAIQRQRFQDLVRQWKEATLFLSSITDMAMHPAYQQIIGMGQEALPLLLEELRREPDHWFWALQAITGVNPVPTQDQGDITRMTQAWLALCRAKPPTS